MALSYYFYLLFLELQYCSNRVYLTIISCFTMPVKRLSIETRAEIAAQYPQKSMGELSKQYNVSKCVIHNIVKKKRETGTVADRPRSGRPRISTTRDDRTLVRLSLRHRFYTAGALRHLWSVPASTSTIKRRLFNAGLRGCVSMKKPPLTSLHRKQRLLWCRARQDWTLDQWRSIIFSDESSFSLLPTTTRLFVRRRPNESHSLSCISPSLKWRTPKLMVWGAISGAGVGPLHRCTGNINQHVYRSILNEYEDYLSNGILAQDNAPCHKTNLIKMWMDEHGVQAIPWPSCSPDLNPIEQIWAYLKRSMQGKHFDSKDSLWQELNRLWVLLSPDFIRRYVDSMPRRVSAVIAAKGGNTRY